MAVIMLRLQRLVATQELVLLVDMHGNALLGDVALAGFALLWTVAGCQLLTTNIAKILGDTVIEEIQK